MTLTSQNLNSPDLSWLMRAMDRLDDGVRPADPDQMATHLQRVCTDQGLPITSAQAQQAARAVSVPPMASTSASNPWANRPKTHAIWITAMDQVARRTRRLRRIWQGATVALSVVGFALGYGCMAMGRVGSNTPGKIWCEVVFGLCIGAVVAMLPFIALDRAWANLKKLRNGLRATTPDWGHDLRGRHWSDSDAAMRAYRELQKTSVPLLNQDVGVLCQIASADWHRQEQQRITQHLAKEDQSNIVMTNPIAGEHPCGER